MAEDDKKDHLEVSEVHQSQQPVPQAVASADATASSPASVVKTPPPKLNKGSSGRVEDLGLTPSRCPYINIQLW